MSNYARQEKLDDFKSGLCDFRMQCGMCICEVCPRDCEDCRVGRGIEPQESGCLYEGFGRDGQNRYRKEEQE